MIKCILVGICILPQIINAADFSISLSSANVIPGSTFTIDIKADQVSDLYGFEINIIFDSAKLQIISIQQGDFLNESGTVNTFWMNPHIDNVNGKITNIVGLRLANGIGRSGSGILARIQIREKASLVNPYLTYLDFEQMQTKLATSLAQTIIPAKYQPAAIKVGHVAIGDNTLDDHITLQDFSNLALFWMLECEYPKDNCFWSDYNNDRIVNMNDLTVLSENWLH